VKAKTETLWSYIKALFARPTTRKEPESYPRNLLNWAEIMPSHTPPRPLDPHMVFLENWIYEIVLSEFQGSTVTVITILGIEDVHLVARNTFDKTWIAEVGQDRQGNRYRIRREPCVN